LQAYIQVASALEVQTMYRPGQNVRKESTRRFGYNRR